MELILHSNSVVIFKHSFRKNNKKDRGCIYCTLSTRLLEGFAARLPPLSKERKKERKVKKISVEIMEK